MPALTVETIRRHVDETVCDWCASPLYVGDRAVYDLAAGTAYCCRSCAQEDAADLGHGGGPLTSHDGSAQAAYPVAVGWPGSFDADQRQRAAQAARHAAARERIGNDPHELDDDEQDRRAYAEEKNARPRPSDY